MPRAENPQAGPSRKSRRRVAARVGCGASRGHRRGPLRARGRARGAGRRVARVGRRRRRREERCERPRRHREVRDEAPAGFRIPERDRDDDDGRGHDERRDGPAPRVRPSLAASLASRLAALGSDRTEHASRARAVAEEALGTAGEVDPTVFATVGSVRRAAAFLRTNSRGVLRLQTREELDSALAAAGYRRGW